jgi:5'-nucleotidase
MSAAPGDMVEEYLKENNLLKKNVYVVANRYEFDSKGRAIKIKEPIIHTFNKNEVSLRGTPAFEAVKNRKNVLLLGDEIGDLGMIEGFDFDNLLRIGFLNENVNERIGEYKKEFDAVLTNDSDFSFVNKLLESFR